MAVHYLFILRPEQDGETRSSRWISTYKVESRDEAFGGVPDIFSFLRLIVLPRNASGS